MKRTCCAWIVFLSVMTARAQTNEKFHLVEVTELTQTTTVQVVTAEMYQSLQADMAVKNQLLPKALELTAKEWSEQHADSGPFPRQVAAKGQIKSLGVFADKAKAEQELKDRQAREDQPEKKKLSGIERQLVQLKDQLQKLRALSSPTAEQQKQINSLQGNIKMFEDQMARKKKRDDDKDAALILARTLFNNTLEDLLPGTKGK
jgi:hypothetical protein